MHDPVSHSHSVRAAAAVAPSLLRASVMQRIAIAALLAAVLWLAVAWALDAFSPGISR